MPWSDNSGNRGSGDRGPTRGPWGQPPRNQGSGGDDGRGRGEPPDLEELLQASRQRLKRAFPRGGKGGGGGPGLSRNTLMFAGAAVLALWLASGFYQVDTDELAVVTTFGEYDSVKRPGLHWHIPFPVQNARLEKVTTVRPTIIPDEAAARRAGSLEGLMLTGDKNIVDVDIQVQWKIKEDLQPTDDGALPPVAQFIFNIDDPENVVRTVGEAAIREVVGRHPLEFIQTAGRDEIQAQTRALMQEAFDLYRSGIEVRSVNILNTDPPTEEVNAAFLDVEAAKQNRENSINEARAYANRVIPEARGEAQRILEGARGYAARVTAEARGQSARFEAILAEYKSAPEVTRRRMYLETVEKVLNGKPKIIIDDEAAGGVVPYLPLNELQRNQAQRNQGGGQ